VNYDDDDDTDVVQLTNISTQSDVEPMMVDQTGTDQVISPPSDFESLTPRQDFVHVPDPAFDIDDVHMEQSDLDVDMTRDIVSRGDLVEFPDYLVVQSSQYGGQNAPLALPPSTSEDKALIPLGTSNILSTSRSDEPEARASKRYRIEYEQANAALETPSTYQDAMASPQSKMWSEAIKTVCLSGVTTGYEPN
jgi:hypothetical protein